MFIEIIAQDLCTAYVDLIILAESSNVTKFEYNQLTSWHPGIVVFLNNLLQQLEMGSNAFKIAIILYSSGIDDVMTFTTNKNFGSNSISYLRPNLGGNRLDQALDVAVRMFDYYSRKDAVKRIVLLSGSPSENFPDTFIQVAKAKSIGVDFVAVGFGRNYDISEIKMIAPGWVLTVPDAGMLYSIVTRIATRLCKSPVHGQWSEWNNWSQCSVSCGSGVKSRKRDCNDPSPDFGGKYCDSTSQEDTECYIQSCYSFFNLITLLYLELTKMQLVQLDQLQLLAPKFKCQDLILKTSYYIFFLCVVLPLRIVNNVHGGWSDWSAWSSCDCIHGTRERIRKCNNPVPQHNGQNCFVDGHWSKWSSWSDCTVSCGNGSTTRIRQCNNPAPMNGGETCTGYTIDS
ncbi:LOW QUALITY PROTEIN: hypothetical protein KUTeg_024813, partial [Tegillarca granosa]